MIEARTAVEPNTTPVVKPQTITVTMIIEDLNNGIDRTGIQTKYSLEKWEVTQMFQHPSLKGRKAKKVRKLSFNFVDDTTTDPNQTSIAVETTPAEDFHNKADLRTQDAIDNDVDVHTEASMVVEATPELSDKIFAIEEDEDDDELNF
jgi:hypothetical protein